MRGAGARAEPCAGVACEAGRQRNGEEAWEGREPNSVIAEQHLLHAGLLSKALDVSGNEE
jgi:hypothetical protein